MNYNIEQTSRAKLSGKHTILLNISLEVVLGRDLEISILFSTFSTSLKITANENHISI